MARIGPLIWFWSLIILPFTAILTFITTLIVCINVPNNAPKGEKYPQISQLGTGEAYYYFVTGFALLAPQFLIITIGRLQFLFQSQYLIHRAILSIVHALALLACIFMLVMAAFSIESYVAIHLTGAFGMFGLISSYCFFQTMLVLYLFIQRSNAPQHSNVICPIWFFICSLILIAAFVYWLISKEGIPEYIAAASPFLYLLGFVPQFWIQARAKKRDSLLPEIMRYNSETDV